MICKSVCALLWTSQIEPFPRLNYSPLRPMSSPHYFSSLDFYLGGRIREVTEERTTGPGQNQKRTGRTTTTRSNGRGVENVQFKKRLEKTTGSQVSRCRARDGRAWGKREENHHVQVHRNPNSITRTLHTFPDTNHPYIFLCFAKALRVSVHILGCFSCFRVCKQNAGTVLLYSLANHHFFNPELLASCACFFRWGDHCSNGDVEMGRDKTSF